jgi:hypothetical protein
MPSYKRHKIFNFPVTFSFERTCRQSLITAAAPLYDFYLLFRFKKYYGISCFSWWSLQDDGGKTIRNIEKYWFRCFFFKVKKEMWTDEKEF